MKLLVVEDECKTASFLKRGLEEVGFVVGVAQNGIDAVHELGSGSYDLVILDVLIPGMNGWDVLRWLRGAGMRMPVLMLTARDAVYDRVRGLELGADDYLIKPFAFAELLARVRTIMRRAQLRNSIALHVGDLELDLTTHRALRAGRRLELTAQEFRLLSVLAEHAGEVLTRTLIAEAVWNVSSTDDSNVVDVGMRRLRSKLDDPFARKLLRTVRGVGYVLEEPE